MRHALLQIPARATPMVLLVDSEFQIAQLLCEPSTTHLLQCHPWYNTDYSSVVLPQARSHGYPQDIQGRVGGGSRGWRATPSCTRGHAAIINKDATKLAELIQTGSAQVHPESLETPLHTAARVGSIDCLRWLLENRIKSPLDRARNGSTPAHYAAVYGRLEALKVK